MERNTRCRHRCSGQQNSFRPCPQRAGGGRGANPTPGCGLSMVGENISGRHKNKNPSNLSSDIRNTRTMEEDRAETDLGIAVDVEERLEEEAARKVPKKRFVGRRQATEAAAKIIPNGAVEDSGAIQGEDFIWLFT